MTDVGLVLDVELYQQIELSCRRVDFGGQLGIRELVRDGVGLAELTLDLNKERDHSPLRPSDSRLHAIQQNRAALTRRAATHFGSCCMRNRLLDLRGNLNGVSGGRAAGLRGTEPTHRT